MMRAIKLSHPFKFHHAEIPGGTKISVPPDLAVQLVEKYQVAEYAEPERAVIEPMETRVSYPPPPPPPPDQNIDPGMHLDGPKPKRKRKASRRGK